MLIKDFTAQLRNEYDSCGIYAQLDKLGNASRKPIEAGLNALIAMNHRAGFISEEGDGCGLQIDLPRQMWKTLLEDAGVSGELVTNERFYIGHLFIKRSSYLTIIPVIEKILQNHGVSVLLKRVDQINQDALGPNARCENPVFLQLSGICPDPPELLLFKIQAELEEITDVHVASLSRHTVVYKAVGTPETLVNYFKDLQDERCTTSFVLAHTRYSTNTATTFARVQPFGILGHNGEINTIKRFFSEACMLDMPINPDFSDSQMIDWGLHSFLAKHGFSLYEAVELVFPAIINEMKQMPKKMGQMYNWLRSLWGPFAQGPAALIMRYGDEAVFSVDALGLRPLWLIHTKESYCFSSEPGIISPEFWIEDPKPLAPGEKIGAKQVENKGQIQKQWQLYSYKELQSEVLKKISQRYRFFEYKGIHSKTAFSQKKDYENSKPFSIRAAAYGFRKHDFNLLEAQLSSGAEPIQSLGFDQSIPALSSELSLLSDYLQEAVAVVTNPAIDREREIEHFSTRIVLGSRPSFSGEFYDLPRLEIVTPLLLDEIPMIAPLFREDLNTIAKKHGTLLYEDVLAQLNHNNHSIHQIFLHRKREETSAVALKRFQEEAVEAAKAGAHVIVLDDRTHFIEGDHLDPFVVLASINHILSQTILNGESLRRRLSIIFYSGGIRNLHDIVVAIAFGANAIVPYHMWEFAGINGGTNAVENLLSSLTKGLEKVISTLGIHEIRGYERLFGGIGISSEIAELLGVPVFCGSKNTGYSFARMDDESRKRAAIYLTEDEKKLRLFKPRSYFPSICKSASSTAKGQISYEQYLKALEYLENKNPISIRHVLRMKEMAPAQIAFPIEKIDSTIDGHAFPFIISSMSFGSQGETSFLAYAEAAYRLNILSLSGEGGEIKDILHKYPRNRGREIASGRFGVNAELCNDAYVLEIKIGQGAKPGEGGHLPGSKVTEKVAAARNAVPGIDLISPSNNHDIYSIEDLAQVIYELKQVNPMAKIAVKVPIVPNIGTISVGIVKAGADIVELSGFDGGTGAARSHAIRHVGLPIEIGIKLAHDSLCEAGLRDSAEIWADGGMKSGTDVIKAILLGANRVGFATIAIAAIGCTDCKMCMERKICSMFNEPYNKGEIECTHGKTVHCLHDFEGAVSNLERFFSEIGRHVQEWTSRLGFKRTQDLVGRRDLLEQIAAKELIDLQWLLEVDETYLGKGTKVEFSSLVVEDKVVKDSSSLYTSVPPIQAVKRALGVFESGQYVRENSMKGYPSNSTTLFEHFAVAGAGFAAFQSNGMVSIAYGGSQDGTGKAALGGKIVVLKKRNNEGVWVGGSVGKGLAYGAQGGLFLIQGNADARAGIRLSGADIVIGGELQWKIQDEAAFIGARANIKGFAFEYMTAGRAIVLGDPGPWICSGMTGGRVYLRVIPEAGLTKSTLLRRLAKGAKVELLPLDQKGIDDIYELLTEYQLELKRSGQMKIANDLEILIKNSINHFIMVEPQIDVYDQDIATE